LKQSTVKAAWFQHL